MAAIFARRPVLTTAAATAVVGTALYMSRPAPLRLDSAYREPSKTLSFPRSMIFSQSLKVKAVEQVNHDTKRITFELPGGEREISGVPASSAILTQHTAPGDWLPTLRPYTPISPPTQKGTLDLVVKHYPSGRASTHMHNLQPGDSLTVRGPSPGYGYKSSPAEPRSVVLVAGGAGITPIFSLAREILTNDTKDQTSVQLLWGVNGSRDIVLRRELEELEAQFPQRLRVTYAVSGSGPVEDDKEKYRKGYVDRALLEEAIAKCGCSFGDQKGTKVFLCGPPKMEEAVAGKSGVLAELGLGKKEIHRF